MDCEKIIADLNRRFALPLPEFFKRRIIFWKDAEREYEDLLSEIILDNAKLVILTGKNNFEIKRLLTVDDTASNFLVYDPLCYPNEENWLLNIELYSEEFHWDQHSKWMEEIGLPVSPALRSVVKKYQKFMGNKERRAKVAALCKSVSTASQLHLAVMAAICKEKDSSANAIIRSVLANGLIEESNSVYKDFVTYDAIKPFWILVKQATGYQADEPNLSDFASHIMLTALSRTIREEKISILSSFISIPHQVFCYDLISDWLHNVSNGKLYALAREIEEKHQLYYKFNQFPIDDLVGTEIFPCVDECILCKLMEEIKDDLIRSEVIRETVETRRTTVWYSYVENYYEAVYQIAEMQDFYVKHSEGFHSATAKEIWKLYTTEYYKMDSYYRQFNHFYQICIKQSNTLLDDMVKAIGDKVEGLYTVWFLGKLGNNWSDICADELREYGFIQGVSKQEDFYASRVRNADSRVFVIVSDAMRYEVGVELKNRLTVDTQCKVEIQSCQSLFPSITKFGMAALLPHKKLTVVEKSGALSVIADGQPTDSQYRDRLLKIENYKSVALKYRELIEMKRAERQELVKGMEVVYIYHDKIDETAHTAEKDVFTACEDAIEEIKNTIQIICNDFGGTRILITSDHGFLYTAKPLVESDKVDKTNMGGQVIEYARRYAITSKGARSEYLLPIKFMDGSQYDGFAPRENIRIKMNGGGMNFVHGGISLQEIVVPIIEYRFLRNKNAEYQRNRERFDTKPVEIGLLSASRKIYNMIFSLNFYQKEVVGGIKIPATYLLYFIDENGTPVSDIVKIIANKTSINEQERTFRCIFHLKSVNYNKQAKYYLLAEEETGSLAPQKVEFQIDTAFSVGEWDFFNDED